MIEQRNIIIFPKYYHEIQKLLTHSMNYCFLKIAVVHYCLFGTVFIGIVKQVAGKVLVLSYEACLIISLQNRKLSLPIYFRSDSSKVESFFVLIAQRRISELLFINCEKAINLKSTIENFSVERCFCTRNL